MTLVYPRRHGEQETRRLVEARRDSPTVPMSEVMAETLERHE
ncbi:hypothetical protein [Nocardiopsis sp. NRRL B-16309]|nr:hypothetical protein [Nocardiopsis sp. NRRL B-16309]